jgi:ABC-type sugar transport system substrate-binding protein
MKKILMASVAIALSFAAVGNANAEEKIKVAWLSYGIGHEWFRSLSIFAEAEANRIAARDGVEFEFKIFDGARNIQTQLQQVDDLIAQGDVDLIYFEPIDQNAMATAVKRINEQLNIPIAAAGIVTNGGKYVYVGLDNVSATERVGTALADLLDAKYGKGKWPADGKIVEIWGPAGISITDDRHKGFRNTFEPRLEENAGVEIVDGTGNWDPVTAFKVSSDLISRYGDKIIGVYTHDDPSATEGVVRALDLAGMQFPVGDPKHIPIVTYDGTKTGVQAVRDQTIDVITEQPSLGYATLVMHYLYEWHKNGYDSLPKPGTTLGTDELAALFPDETGVRSWSPVEVREGDGWEGIWLAPKSPLIPTEVDPYAQNQWGNYMYFLDKGSFPEK